MCQEHKPTQEPGPSSAPTALLLQLGNGVQGIRPGDRLCHIAPESASSSFFAVGSRPGILLFTRLHGLQTARSGQCEYPRPPGH